MRRRSPAGSLHSLLGGVKTNWTELMMRQPLSHIAGYFDEQQKKYLQDLQNQDSPYFHLLHRKLEETTGARPYGAFELLSERPELKEKIDGVIQHYLTAFQKALVVKLIQSKLTTEFGVDPITQEFRFYADIVGRNEDEGLAAAIQTWSETWNLNADWCRDHAVAVMVGHMNSD
jgi:hypothetical protein